jgi:hypothetical protein
MSLGLDTGTIRDILLEIQKGDVRCSSWSSSEYGRSSEEISKNTTGILEWFGLLERKTLHPL